MIGTHHSEKWCCDLCLFCDSSLFRALSGAYGNDSNYNLLGTVGPGYTEVAAVSSRSALGCELGQSQYPGPYLSCLGLPGILDYHCMYAFAIPCMKRIET